MDARREEGRDANLEKKNVSVKRRNSNVVRNRAILSRRSENWSKGAPRVFFCRNVIAIGSNRETLDSM